MSLLLTNVKKSFNNQMILKGIDLEINEHEFICILGHSGCGKSTMLNLIAGFTQPDIGSIAIDPATVDYIDLSLLKEVNAELVQVDVQ